MRLHQPGSHCSPCPDDSLRPRPTQFAGPPNLFPVDFPHEWPILAHTSDFPKISQTSSIWPQHAPYLSPSGPSPGTNGSQLWFATCLSWAPPSSAQVAAICKLLCSSFWVAPGKTQEAVDFGQYLLGDSRASSLSGQFQITLKHYHSTTATGNMLKGQTQWAPEYC